MPIILLHGFPEHWWSWRHQIAPLVTAGYAVWAADLRGYHLSDRPRPVEAYDIRLLTQDAADLVRATGAPRAHIVGHDWGGVIAWCLAGSRPELVEKLAILNAPHLEIYFRWLWRSTQWIRSAYVPFFALPWLPERVIRAGRFRLVGSVMPALAVRKDALTDDVVKVYVDALAGPGALTAALNYYRANFRSAPLAWARAARISAETLVIWGLGDPCLSPILLDDLVSVAPHVRIHRVPGAGHWVHAEAPGDVNQALLAFLSS